MPIKEWRRLLRSLENVSASGTETSPVADRAINQFEREMGINLPRGYCDFCRVFGAGRLAGEFTIAVPGYPGTPLMLNLDYLNRAASDVVDDWFDDGNPARESYLYFASDGSRAFYFFDTRKVTDSLRHEYLISRIDRGYTIRRTAGTFWDFVVKCCLGTGRRQLFRGLPVERSFLPFRE